MMAKTVDSYRFLHGIEKRVLKRWAGLPEETQSPWTPLATPISKCSVSLVSSAGIALKPIARLFRKSSDGILGR